MMKKIIILLVFIVLLVSSVFAIQPNYGYQQQNNEKVLNTDKVEIKEMVQSQYQNHIQAMTQLRLVEEGSKTMIMGEVKATFLGFNVDKPVRYELNNFDGSLERKKYLFDWMFKFREGEVLE